MTFRWTRDQTLALVLAALCGCGGADTPEAGAAGREASAEQTTVAAPPEQSEATCAGVVAESEFERAVDGAHRGCLDDADCVSVRLDCSNIRCTAVHRDHAAAYDASIDCAGYTGMVANYDCMPQFGSERPVCVQGCCTSERESGRATSDEACGAISEVYSRDSCTVFGPTFSVDQCLTDVAEIRSESDPAAARQLQIGLDCARTIATCEDLGFCVAQFRGPGSRTEASRGPP